MKTRAYHFRIVLILILVCLTAGLAAVFTACAGESVEVVFYANGKEIHSESVKAGATVTLPDCQVDGYTFDGWYLDDKKWQKPFTESTLADEKLTGKVKVYAKLIGDEFTISYEYNGGSAGDNPSTYRQGESIDLGEAYKQYYNFGGWYADAALTQSVDDTSELSGDVVLYAKWNNRSHRITYVLNGGTNHPSNPTTFNEADTSITLYDPNGNGKDFMGWYLDEDFTEVFTVKSVQGRTRDITLYARWGNTSQLEIAGEPFGTGPYAGGCSIKAKDGEVLSGKIIVPSIMKDAKGKSWIVMKLESDAFISREGIEYVDLPGSIVEIGMNAFAGTGLRNIVIPDSVTTLGYSVFLNCLSLEWVVLPASIKQLQLNLFKGATKLQSVYYRGDAAQWAQVTGKPSSYVEAANVYFYVENEADVPTDGGLYWHFDATGKPVVWEVKPPQPEQ